MKKNLYIIIENTKREIDAKLFLSLKILKKNYNIIIGHKGTMWNLFPYFEPGIVFLKSYGPRNTKILKYLKKRNFKLVASDEEMIGHFDFETLVSYRNDAENFERLDQLFTVGNDDTNELKKVTNNSKKIYKTGSLRIDILKNQINKIFKKQSEQIKSTYGDFILLATSFPRINSLNIDKETGIDPSFNLLVTGPNPNELLYSEKTVENSHRLFHFQRHMLEKYIYFILKFNKEYPNKKILIKPHSIEKVGFYTNFVNKRKLKNVEVIIDKEQSTMPWLLASDCILTSNSTIAIEAFILKKKCINYYPTENFWKVEKPILKIMSKIIRNEDELIKTLSNVENMNSDYLQSNTEDYIKNSSNENFAVDSIINKLEELDVDLTKDVVSSIYKRIYLKYINFSRQFKNFIKRMPFYQNSSHEYKMHKAKIGNGFKYDNIKKRTEEIGEILGIENTKVKQIVPLVFQIYQE